ncbi:MAG: hypothetical protein J6126_02760, partial [Clostridia bacterium]|nr:hypothetical protein [Clostridia bacterium]
MAKTTLAVHLETADKLSRLLGIYDENLNIIAKELGVEAYTENADIIVTGEEAEAKIAEIVLNKLSDIISAGETVDKTRVIYCIEMAREGNADGIEKIVSGVIAVTARGKQIKCKTVGQKKY